MAKPWKKPNPRAVLPPDARSFSARLKYCLDRQGITRCEMAARVYVSNDTMCRYVRGEYTPSLDVAIAIARVLGVSLDWLAGLTDKQQKRR